MGRGRNRTRRKARLRRRMQRVFDGEEKRASIVVTNADGKSVLEVQPRTYTVNFDTDYLDATQFGNANKTYLAGLRKVRIDAEL